MRTTHKSDLPEETRAYLLERKQATRLSHQQIAKLANVSLTTVQNVMNGRAPRASVLQAIITALGGDANAIPGSDGARQLGVLDSIEAALATPRAIDKPPCTLPVFPGVVRGAGLALERAGALIDTAIGQDIDIAVPREITFVVTSEMVELFREAAEEPASEGLGQALWSALARARSEGHPIRIVLEESAETQPDRTLELLGLVLRLAVVRPKRDGDDEIEGLRFFVVSPGSALGRVGALIVPAAGAMLFLTNNLGRVSEQAAVVALPMYGGYCGNDKMISRQEKTVDALSKHVDASLLEREPVFRVIAHTPRSYAEMSKQGPMYLNQRARFDRWLARFEALPGDRYLVRWGLSRLFMPADAEANRFRASLEKQSDIQQLNEGQQSLLAGYVKRLTASRKERLQHATRHLRHGTAKVVDLCGWDDAEAMLSESTRPDDWGGVGIGPTDFRLMVDGMRDFIESFPDQYTLASVGRGVLRENVIVLLKYDPNRPDRAVALIEWFYENNDERWEFAVELRERFAAGDIWRYVSTVMQQSDTDRLRALHRLEAMRRASELQTDPGGPTA